MTDDPVALTYTGSTPGANTNATVLFSSVAAFPMASACPMLGLRRLSLDLAHSHNGTLNLYKSGDRGLNWVLVSTEAITAGSTTTEKEWLIEMFRDFKLEWANGGTAQTTWNVNLALDQSRSAVGSVDPITAALAIISATSPAVLLWGGNVVVNGSNPDAGDQISQWTDTSGNNRNFTQSTEANQPSWAGYVITHDPTPTSGEFVTAPASVNTLLSGATEVSVAYINKRTDRTSTCYAWRADLDLAHFFVSTGSEQTRFYFNGTGNHAQVSPGNLLNQWKRWIYRFKQAEATDADRIKIALDGVALSTTVTGTFNAPIASVGTCNIGGGATSTTGMRGQTALWVLWTRTLTDLEVTAIDGAMTTLQGYL